MVCWNLKLAEYNVNTEHNADKENATVDNVSHNPQKCIELVDKVKFCVLSSLALTLKEQKQNPSRLIFLLLNQSADG